MREFFGEDGVSPTRPAVQKGRHVCTLRGAKFGASLVAVPQQWHLRTAERALIAFVMACVRACVCACECVRACVHTSASVSVQFSDSMPRTRARRPGASFSTCGARLVWRFQVLEYPSFS